MPSRFVAGAIATVLGAVPALAHVTVGGTISTSTTWGIDAPAADGVYWATSTVTVRGGATLTIEPGVVVKLGPGQGLHLGDGSTDGFLSAAGTAGSPIIFTSIKDDTVGGDTNGDGNATAPAPGDWGRLLFSRGNGGTMAHCVVRHAGSGGTTAIYFSNGAPAGLDDSVIRDVPGGAIDVAYAAPGTMTGNTILDAGQHGIQSLTGNTLFPLTFTGNLIQGCGGWPVKTHPTHVPRIDPSNVFAANGNQGIFVLQGTLTTSAHVWPDLSVPFYLSGYLRISSGSLTLPPGAILKAHTSDPNNGYVAVLLNGGTLSAIGTEAEPIVFTSILDDAHGGDTNGDGAASSPFPGAWGGIQFNPGGGALEQCEIHYAGQSGTRGIGDISGSLARIVGCTVASSLGDGIYVQATTLSEVSGTTVAGSGGTGMRFSTGAFPPAFTGNVLTGNGAWPLEVAAGEVRDIGPGNTFTGNVKNGIRVMQDVIAGTHAWPVHPVPYHMSSSWTQVNAGATLTISPGAILKFSPGTGLALYGALVADGAPGNPITFTSERDDTIGGDTNGDGGATLPAPGDWDQLYYYVGSSGVLDGCTFRYAGRNNVVTIYLWQGAPSQITNTTIRDSYAGLRAQGAMPSVLSGNTIAACTTYGLYFGAAGWVPSTFTGNTVTGCGTYPVYMAAWDSWKVQASNVFSGNGQNVIWLTGGALPAASLAWHRFDAPYYLAGSVSVPSGGTLTLAPGTTVKLWNTYLDVAGSLVAEGTVADPVTFTSFRDDSVGGDSNGDGGATTAAPGNWHYLRCGSACGASLKHARVRYGGSVPSFGMLYCQSCAGAGFLSVEDSVVSDSLGRGLHASGASALSVKRTAIERNAVGIYAEAGAIPTIGGSPADGNTFTANTTYAVQQAGSGCIPAHYNDWGAADGPLDPSSTADACGLAQHLGSGQPVSNNVDYGAPAPLGVTATPYNTVVDVAWDDVDGVSGYNVHRSTVSGGPYTKVNGPPVAGAMYRDTGLTNGTTYYYVVRSVSLQTAEGRSSAQVAATPSAAGGVTPVTDLSVRVVGNDVVLEWTSITTENGVAFHRVYRVLPGSVPPYDRAAGTVIGSPVTSPFVHVGAAVDGDEHSYDVATVDGLGAEATDGAPPAPAAVTGARRDAMR